MEGLDYVVSLDDQMSGPAGNASRSLSGLQSTAGKAKSGLEGLTHGLIQVQQPTETLKGSLSAAADGMRSFLSAVVAGDAKGAVQGITDTMAGLAQMLDLVVPGLGQAASALIKVAGGFAAIAAGLVQDGLMMAISATQGKHAMISMFDALGMGVTTGEAVEGMLSDLSDRIGITKDTLAPLTKEFMAMGVQGTAALEHLTLAAISAQAIMSDPAAAGAFTELQRKIQAAALAGTGLKLGEKALIGLSKTGANVADVADRMGMSIQSLEAGLKAGTIDATKFGDALSDSLIAKGAGPLDRLGSSLGNLKKMFTQSLEDMFEDIPIEPFIKEVKSLFAIFGQANPSGKAMKSAIGGAFTFIFQAMTKVVPYIKHFLLDVVIWSLKAYILMKSHWSTIKAVLLGVAVVFGIIAVSIGVGISVFVALAAVIGAVVAGIAWLIGKFIEMGPAALKGAQDIVNGLVNGLGGGSSFVVEAAKKLATAAISGIKSVLGIASDSKVMIKVGQNTTGGLAGSLTQGAGDVEAAAAQVGGAVTSGTTKGMNSSDYGGAKSAGGGEAGAGGGSTGPITINITAPSGVTHALELTEIGLAALLERLKLSQGA